MDKPSEPAKPAESRCTCKALWKNGVLCRIVNPRCPEHGNRNHLQPVK